MPVVLIVIGGVAVITAGVVGLLRAGFPRPAIAPVAAALVGALLIALGILLWPSPHRTQPPAPVAAPSASSELAPTPSDAGPTPAPAAGADCTWNRVRLPASPPASFGSGASLLNAVPADTQHLPSEFSPGRPAGGTLVPSASVPNGNTGYDEMTQIAIAPALIDFSSADYDDLSLTGTGGIPFIQLAVGTPEPGICWDTLVHTALSTFEGPGHVFNARVERIDQRMSEYHLILQCAEYAEAVDMCAWAGPGKDGRHPLFGILRLTPFTSTVSRGLTDNVMATFAEKVFETSTAA